MNIFITATGTNVGKTFVTLKLIKKFRKMGYKVGVLKPIETGVKNTPKDGKKLYKALDKDLRKKLSIDDIVPIQMKLPAAPYIAKTKKINYEKIYRAYNKIKKLCDILLIEGAGGIFVPLDKRRDMTYFIKKYKAKTILITRDSLGTISDTVAYTKQLKSQNIDPIVFVNIRDKKDFMEKTYPYFKDNIKNLIIDIKDLSKCINEN